MSTSGIILLVCFVVTDRGVNLADVIKCSFLVICTSCFIPFTPFNFFELDLYYIKVYFIESVWSHSCNIVVNGTGLK